MNAERKIDFEQMDYANDPGPMFRIPFPSFRLSKFAPKKTEPEPKVLRQEFQSLFEHDLKSGGILDFRLSSRERRQIERTQRVRSALVD